MARVRVAGTEPMALSVGVSERQVRTHVAHLEGHGLVRRNQIRDGGGAVAAITPRGIRAAGYEANSHTTTSSLEGMLHGRGVSWAAAYLDARGREWLGPGELRTLGWHLPVPGTDPGHPGHVPDLGLFLDGERWAVEFELRPRTKARLRTVLGTYRKAELSGQLDGVFFVCATDQVVRKVQTVATEIGVDRAVRSLDGVKAEVQRCRSQNARKVS